MVEFHMCALYFLYLPGPDLGDAFLEAALQLLQFLGSQIAHRITDQMPSQVRYINQNQGISFNPFTFLKSVLHVSVLQHLSGYAASQILAGSIASDTQMESQRNGQSNLKKNYTIQ